MALYVCLWGTVMKLKLSYYDINPILVTIAAISGTQDFLILSFDIFFTFFGIQPPWGILNFMATSSRSTVGAGLSA